MTPCKIEKKSPFIKVWFNRWCKQNIRRSRKRVWGNKRERIRQIEAKALKKLKEKSSDKKLDDYINR